MAFTLEGVLWAEATFILKGMPNPSSTSDAAATDERSESEPAIIATLMPFLLTMGCPPLKKMLLKSLSRYIFAKVHLIKTYFCDQLVGFGYRTAEVIPESRYHKHPSAGSDDLFPV